MHAGRQYLLIIVETLIGGIESHGEYRKKVYRKSTIDTGNDCAVFVSF